MSKNIIETLESKGIKVPEHHIPLLINQWKAFQQLKKNPNFTKLADQDIGLKNIPGGIEYEQ